MCQEAYIKCLNRSCPGYAHTLGLVRCENSPLCEIQYTRVARRAGYTEQYCVSCRGLTKQQRQNQTAKSRRDRARESRRAGREIGAMSGAYEQQQKSESSGIGEYEEGYLLSSGDLFSRFPEDAETGVSSIRFDQNMPANYGPAAYEQPPANSFSSLTPRSASPRLISSNYLSPYSYVSPYAATTTQMSSACPRGFAAGPDELVSPTFTPATTATNADTGSLMSSEQIPVNAMLLHADAYPGTRMTTKFLAPYARMTFRK